ncbi:MAG: hypothetical protein LBD25_07810 [Coriobacteriales bacterium]|jgi:hypothetical protein|nr:hypothetical protein [Coriobacteriales bacterium]
MSDETSRASQPSNRASQSSGRALAGAVRYLLKNMGTSTLWYLVIFTGVLVALQPLVTLLSKPDAESTQIALAIVAVNSNNIFLLVMGIVYPLMLELYMMFGVTRRQFARALLVAGAALSVALAVVSGVVAWATASLDALALAGVLASNLLCFLLGWLAVSGFQLRRVLAAAGGILAAIVMASLASMPFASKMPSEILQHADWLPNWLRFVQEPAASLVCMLVMAALLALVLPLLMRQAKLKC